MTKTLFIGMDGATFTVLDDLTRELPGVGVTMPFLKRFMENGVRARLRSTPNPLTPPAWVSLMTGRSPGHHGVFDFLRLEDKGNDIYFTLSDARDIRHETIWSVASRQDRTVAALNFPITAPPRPVNGSIVPGFVPWKHLRRNIHPADLYDRLKSIPDFDPKELAWDFEREQQAVELLSEEDVENWVRYHLPREEQWFRIAQYLLREDGPDLMAVMFDGVDKIQHQAWDFLDPALVPGNPTPREQRMRDLCLEYFRRLDGYIEQLVTLAGPDAQVFMASDHGFTASVELLRLNTFLAKKGYLHWRASDGSEAGKRREQSWFANLDWSKTVAYCGTPSSNGVSIRVARRAGEPGVTPEQYEDLRERIRQDLLALVDEQGEPVVTRVYKREEVFSGPAMQQAPDLLLVLRDFGFVSIRNVEPVLERRPTPVGTHHPDGIFLAGGPGVRQGVEIDRRNIIDVPATMLHSLGLPVPQDFEGEAPAALFTDTWSAGHPVRIGAATLPVKDGEVLQDAISEDDKNKLMEQLQMLGYME